MMSNMDALAKAARITSKIMGRQYLRANKERIGYGTDDEGDALITVFRIHMDGKNCTLPKRYWNIDQVYTYIKIRKSDGAVIDLDYQTEDGRTPDNEDASKYL